MDFSICKGRFIINIDGIVNGRLHEKTKSALITKRLYLIKIFVARFAEPTYVIESRVFTACTYNFFIK